ncbi:hypothetical protein CcI49_30185 [Frankia sp. CcI49]|uniref:hypothetical protein n=1 Tax=Frankia sp. CcI49 TaxID=1745382 RepID=UPI0009D1845C|nr:hypothetical protein [Frankia sp. CcI49]ONH54631.1 hypothetical protein CcI49_30185 [Frankia sp. CcI49]
MLIGYVQVATADQSPDHQIDALERASEARRNIHIDLASGVSGHLDKASVDKRPATTGNAA